MNAHLDYRPLESVPVIDIGSLGEPATLEALDAACRDWGFFQVTGHGIDASVIEGLFAESRSFFAQTLQEKQRIRRSADNPWGFFDSELTKNRRDWKEVYDYGPDDGALMRPQWPPALPEFERAIRDYYDGCERLARRLLSAIAANLGMPAGYLLKDFGSAHTSFLRLNFYPRCPDSKSSQHMGVNEHTDAGALTLLLQDRQPGLEVRRDGVWYLVEPRSDALVINIGDIVQVWSNDRYRAAVHRVITNPENDRYSVPFFLNPSYDTEYKPLPTTISGKEPARYRPINWREFRTLRSAGDYADHGEEIQIHHYAA